MKSKGLVLAFSLLVLIIPARAQEVANELNGRLVALKGKSVLPTTAPDLPQAKQIALYFSAGWCGPCHVSRRISSSFTMR